MGQGIGQDTLEWDVSRVDMPIGFSYIQASQKRDLAAGDIRCSEGVKTTFEQKEVFI